MTPALDDTADVAEVSAGAASQPPAGADPRPRGRSPRRRRVLWVVFGLVAVAVLYVGLTFVQVWRASRQDGARPAGAIVVLGAAQYNGEPSPVLKNRLDQALLLYEQGLAPMIVVTGGRQAGDRFTEATAGYNYLRDRGVPDEAILKEVQGHTTYESIAATRRFLSDEGIDDVILVSGPAHSARLQGIAEDVGLTAVTSPSEGSPSLRSLLRETAAVSVGRIIGYRRLERLDP